MNENSKIKYFRAQILQKTVAIKETEMTRIWQKWVCMNLWSVVSLSFDLWAPLGFKDKMKKWLPMLIKKIDLVDLV